MTLDPVAGTDVLERRLAHLEPMPDGQAINWFASMFGERHGALRVDLKQPEFTPVLLLRILRLAYRYIRQLNDITHTGAYSPGPRDNAQEGRSSLLSAILEAKGPDAWAAKLEMADDPLFAHFRDRIAFLAREKAAEEMDAVVLSESEVAAIRRDSEAPPKTRDEMFALMSDRLDDIDDLLKRDDSPRETWAGIADEKVMRRSIARELGLASKGAYNVCQEAVTADEKETDIRLRSTASDQQAIIELKIGERYSARVLRDTLKSQLVTKYMADENCRSGCLLVTVAKAKDWKHPDSGKNIDVNELGQMLDAEADKVMMDMGNSLRLSCKILNLRPRLPVERERRSQTKSKSTTGI